jgi:ATP-dependent DNA helicase RecG
MTAIGIGPSSPVAALFTRFEESHRKALARLKIATIEDLLYHFPVRYGDTTKAVTLDRVQAGDRAVIYGVVAKIATKKSFRGGVPMAEATIKDAHGSVKVVWFNQPYLAKMLSEGMTVRLDGPVTARKKADGSIASLSMANPHVEPVESIPDGVGDSLFEGDDDMARLYPVYPESKGVTSNWFIHAVKRAFESGVIDAMHDPIPADVLERYKLPSLRSALHFIHAPRKESDAEAARKRFAFEEILLIQLKKKQQRAEAEEKKSFVLDPKPEHVQAFVERFPFALTEAQARCVESILSDLARPHAMSRLLEGDVGSGKTAVAAVATYAATVTRPRAGTDFGSVQTAYMAPTEILATQLFEGFIRFFAGSGITIGLMTGSGCRKFPSKVDPTEATDISRTQLLKWIASGEIPIVVGTHSLIQKTVKFKNLGLVVIDEQHRFGTFQRQKLASKEGFAPHLLSMTATPIPRTLALTLYGDLDLSVLDQMPAGRKPVITDIVRPADRKKTYIEIGKRLAEGRQAYVICPRIDEPDPDKVAAVQAKSAKAEAERLANDVFPGYRVGLMHGKLLPKDKDAVMRKFENGEIDILVSTSVVEVGVNVPNATVMLIEGAERFGLAQLHQLRGRVIRGTYQGYCYLFTDSSTETTLERLGALAKTSNGFELAERDLQLRGAGELSGGKQWGVSDLAMDAIRNVRLVEAAQTEATRLISQDKTLSSYPALAQAVTARGDVHFE